MSVAVTLGDSQEVAPIKAGRWGLKGGRQGPSDPPNYGWRSLGLLRSVIVREPLQLPSVRVTDTLDLPNISQSQRDRL